MQIVIGVSVRTTCPQIRVIPNALERKRGHGSVWPGNEAENSFLLLNPRKRAPPAVLQVVCLIEACTVL